MSLADAATFLQWAAFFLFGVATALRTGATPEVKGLWLPAGLFGLFILLLSALMALGEYT